MQFNLENGLDVLNHSAYLSWSVLNGMLNTRKAHMNNDKTMSNHHVFSLSTLTILKTVSREAKLAGTNS